MKVSPASVKLETKTIPWGAKRANQHGLRVTPDKDPSDSTTIVIAHGARKSMSSPLITFFHVEMARRGFFTVKFNFPYMEARFRLTRTPDPKEILVGCFREVLGEVRSRQSPEKLVIGGLSWEPPSHPMLSPTSLGEAMSMDCSISAIPFTAREDQKNSESITSPRSRDPCCSSQAHETLTRDRSILRILFQNLDRRLVCTWSRERITLSTPARDAQSTSRDLIILRPFWKTG